MAIRETALLVNCLVMAGQELPKAETILDRYVVVTGGQAAYQKHHIEFSSGTVEITGARIKGTVTNYHAEPNYSYMEADFPMIGKIRQGADGEIAWAVSPMEGPKLKEGDERALAMLAARFNSELHWRDLYKRVETVGTEAVDGKEAYIVVMTPKQGKPITEYFDVRTGLLVKVILKEQAATGEVRDELMPSDYRKVDGVLKPHQVVQKAGDREMIIRTEVLTFNGEPPKGTFDLPAEIKASLAKE